MSGECDRCGHHCMDCVCNAPDCTSRALEILSQIDAEDEIARLTSEVTQLRADLANAGAVMVETCAREADAHYAAGDMGNPGHHIRALSTLSPIAAAARVLLDEQARLRGKRLADCTDRELDIRMLNITSEIAEQEKADG